MLPFRLGWLQVCQISDQSLITEVSFVPVYRHLLEQLKQSDDDVSLTTDTTAQLAAAEASIKDLEQILSCSEQLAARGGECIRTFVHTTKLPSFDERCANLLTGHFSATDGDSVVLDDAMLKSMVLFDVAVVSDAPCQVSSGLISSSRASLADVVPLRSSSQAAATAGQFGIGQFAQHLVSLMDSLSVEQSPLNRSSVASLLGRVTVPISAARFGLVGTLFDSVSQIMERARTDRCVEAVLREAARVCEVNIPRGGLVPVHFE